MKIVHITQWYRTGLGYQENHLPYQQARLGHDVTIVTSDRLRPKSRGDASLRFDLGSHDERGVRLLRLPSRWISKQRAQVYLKGLRRQLVWLNPQVVHAHNLWTIPTLQTLFCNTSKLAMFVDDHVDDDNLALHRWQTRLRVGLFKLIFLPRLRRKTCKFISVNPYSKQFLKETLNISAEKIELLPLGIDDDTFFPDGEWRKKSREKFGFNDRHIVLVTSGNISPTKGVDLLIKAMARLFPSHPRMRLLVIGRGGEAYMAYLMKMIEDAGLPDKSVVFSDWVTQDELCRIYNGCDIAVMPKKLGGIKEALAVGLPLIVAQHPATRYFVRKGNGLTFERDDPISLAKAVETYIDNEALRRLHGELSLEFVASELAWREIGEQSVRIYQQAELH